MIDWGVVIPFGIKNGPLTYQKVVTKMFHEYIDVFMKIFLMILRQAHPWVVSLRMSHLDFPRPIKL